MALFTWWAGSYGIAVNRLLISIVIAGLILVNLVLAVANRKDLKEYLRKNWKHLLVTEGVILVFFLIDLGIRIGNPDLWHISKGGEKPMDFAYLNAILKSTTFPPYDPWFSGGYINYYYYGFVIVGVLVKWLGIIPSIAYNLIVPTLFALLAIGGYTILYNLISHSKAERQNQSGGLSAYWFAILAAAALTILGNLGTLRMIWYGLQMLSAPGGDITTVGTSFFTRMLWTGQGLVKFFQGNNLPYGMGEWYWNPSRVIPAINDVEPITEFPMFTFIYSDLHAHMIALPITLFALGWAIQTVLSKGIFGSSKKLGLISLAASLFVGAVGVGALRPTNTWDFPVFAILAGLAIIYFGLTNPDAFNVWILDTVKNRWLRGLIVIGLFVVLTIGLYKPFDAWYGAGYTAVESWQGSHTPPWSYLTHWGIFLFFIISWFIQETIDWMAKTPLRKLAVLKSYAQVIIVLVLVVIAAMIGLEFLGAWISWFVVPIALWAALLIFRPGQSDIKRIVLFLIGTGLFLTLFVEIFVLKGDIGRMNTVFKFYLQVWSLFSIATCAAIYWTFCDFVYWRASRSSMFLSLGWILLLCAFLFPFTATASKIRDRYVPTASHSLDGMEYMLGANYIEQDVNTGNPHMMELEQDYQAIHWMQDNIQGSPVIVEGSVTEYKWGSRYSIYTGLPDVVGWNWHQRQQRGVANPVWVQDRVNEVNNFYTTSDVEEAVAFLKKYHVKYIVVGQMEDIIYPTSGISKFVEYSNIHWKPVYSYKSTTIYEVIGS